MKVENLLEILKLCNDEKPKNQEIVKQEQDGLVKIVILQRGWVIVGEFHQLGNNCWIENGYVIRKWGTTKGLGELAENGKLSDTILDPIPKTEFHILTTVAIILCDQKKWK